MKSSTDVVRSLKQIDPEGLPSADPVSRTDVLPLGRRSPLMPVSDRLEGVLTTVERMVSRFQGEEDDPTLAALPGRAIHPAAPPCAAASPVAAMAGSIPVHRLSRTRHEVRKRQITIYLMHVEAGIPARRVARLVRRDPATIRHALARIEDLREHPAFDQGLAQLGRIIRLVLRLEARP